jgi:hypothetical protein
LPTIDGAFTIAGNLDLSMRGNWLGYLFFTPVPLGHASVDITYFIYTFWSHLIKRLFVLSIHLS